MISSEIPSEIVAKHLSWLKTMKQKDGYGGPVVHYWQNSLNYIGAGTDWRYQDLVASFLELFEKTHQREYLDLASECGTFIIANQCNTGVFFNSCFEANPGFSHGCTPGNAAVSIALLELAKALEKHYAFTGEKIEWQEYINATKKNFELFHLKELYDEKTGLFSQHCKKDAQNSVNPFVPNKMATIVELLLDLHYFSGGEEYLEMAKKNADYIVSMQHSDGGIYQSNEKNKIITFYTARCVEPLLLLHEKTKNQKYLECALKIGEFIKFIANEGGGFFFGQVKEKDSWKLEKYPVFVAGGAEIVRALVLVGKYDKSLLPVKKSFEFLEKNLLESGGFKTARGLVGLLSYDGQIVCWQDVLPVVAWNAKALRLYADLLPEGGKIDLSVEFKPTTVFCTNGIYNETSEAIRITNFDFESKMLFHKQSMFEGDSTFVKEVAYWLSKHFEFLRHPVTAKMVRLLRVK